eukprot:4523962-Prymnesium_polylepis.1
MLSLPIIAADAWSLRADPDNPLLAAYAAAQPFADAGAAFLDAGNSSATADWMRAAARRGERRAQVLLAVLLRYCSVLLSEASVAALCEEYHDTASAGAECSCQTLETALLRAAHRAGDSEAAQALVAQHWRSSRGGHHLGAAVRLKAAAAAGHDGAWPRERPPTPPAELPAIAPLAADDD